MAKKKKEEPKEFYQYINATVTDDGIDLQYRVKGLKVDGHDGLEDETVRKWSDGDITRMVRKCLNVEKDDPVEININHDD